MDEEDCPIGCPDGECRKPQPCHLSSDPNQRREAAKGLANTLRNLMQKAKEELGE